MADFDAVALIKERINIVDLIGRYVPLRQMGGRYVAPCPFHQETKPSFNVTPDGRFYCFGCQKAGDIFTFWMEYHGLSFREALDQLAHEAGVDLSMYGGRRRGQGQESARRGKRQELLLMYRLAQAHFAANLATDAGAVCRAYMDGRGIPKELAERFGLGWAMDDWHDLANFLRGRGCDLELAMEGGLLGKSSKSGKPYDPFRARLMFPIRNTASETIAFGGRIIDKDRDEAKYINSHDSPVYKKGEHLYGLDLAGKAIRVSKKVYLTEGYMDVLTLHQFGFENAVGGLGTALTDQQVQRLTGYGPEVILLYDGDNAGRKAALAAAAKFLARGTKIRVILQPEGEDIDSLLRTWGKDSFLKLADEAVEGLRFCVDTLRLASPKDALDWCRNFLRSMQVPELVSPTISYLARWLDFDEQSLREGVDEDMDKQARGTTAGGDKRPDKEGPGLRPRDLDPRELDILRVAIRYPDRLKEFGRFGADLMLKSPFARGLWRKLVEAGDNAGYELDGEAKRLWNRFRGMEAPPRDAPDAEISALARSLDKYFHSIQKYSLSAVLRQKDAQGNFPTGQDVLDNLQAETHLEDTQKAPSDAHEVDSRPQVSPKS